MSRFSPPISLPCCVKLPSAPAHLLPLPQPSLPQIPPHLPLSDTQRGRSPSLSVPAGKHMLLFPSDSGVWERRDCLMFINHLSVVERGDGDRATHTHTHSHKVSPCSRTHMRAGCLAYTHNRLTAMLPTWPDFLFYLQLYISELIYCNTRPQHTQTDLLQQQRSRSSLGWKKQQQKHKDVLLQKPI